MKLSNIFKKTTTKKSVNVQELDKKQLEKVVGGLDSTELATSADSTTTTTTTTVSGTGAKAKAWMVNN